MVKKSHRLIENKIPAKWAFHPKISWSERFENLSPTPGRWDSGNLNNVLPTDKKNMIFPLIYEAKFVFEQKPVFKSATLQAIPAVPLTTLHKFITCDSFSVL